MKTHWFARVAGVVLALIMVWPFVHRALVVSADVNPWKLFGFAMYCTPHRVRARLATAEGNLVRAIPMEKLPAEHRRALQLFEIQRTSLGKLYPTEPLMRYLSAGLPSSKRFFILVEVTTLDTATATLKATQEVYPVGAGRPGG